MSQLLYYLILKPLSFLPLRVLYFLSSGIAILLFYVVPYRRKVVLTNLSNSFPEKTPKEIKRLARKFYSHLCDLMVESVKLFSVTRQEALNRFKVNNPEFIDEYYDRNIPILIVGAHYNNWEWLATAMDPQVKHQTVGIYSKIENAFFAKKFLSSRSKYGIRMLPIKEVATYFIKGFDSPTATIFGSDQSPTYNKGVVWTTFLNQDTAVANGVERFAKKYNYPVVFGAINKVKRGYYSLDLELISDNPRDMPDEQITKLFTTRIEQQIIEQPEYWLWTHKRWKRKRPVGTSMN